MIEGVCFLVLVCTIQTPNKNTLFRSICLNIPIPNIPNPDAQFCLFDCSEVSSTC